MKTEFSNDQYESGYPDGMENHWWNLARNRILAKAIVNLAGRGAVVLEVGCGRGIVVESLRNSGIACAGVEPADARPLATVAGYIRVRTDALELPAAERVRYDTLLLLDVLEHLPDPAGPLRRLAEAFPNVTHVIITVPACPELWSNYDAFFGHHRRYTIETLRVLAGEIEARCTYAGYFFHSLYPVVWGVVKLGGGRATRLAGPVGPAWWVHRLIAGAMILDCQIVPRRVLGTSVLACFSLGRRRGVPGG